MKGYSTERLHTVAADGISPIIAESVNTMTEEQFEVWKAFHLCTCEKENLLGYSTHILYICRKARG